MKYAIMMSDEENIDRTRRVLVELTFGEAEKIGDALEASANANKRNKGLRTLSRHWASNIPIATS